MTTMTGARFIEPTLEQVEHAFRELQWTERLVGHTMGASTGNMPIDMCGLKDAVVFLVGTSWDRINVESHKANLNWVDVERLITWLRDTVGDAELAEAIETEALPLGNYREQNQAIAELVVQRMLQYEAVLHPDEADSDPEAGSPER